MKKIFTQSKNMKKEYSCQVVRIGEVIPIKNSDFLATTEIYTNMPIVVRKDMIKKGDVMFYVDTESQMNSDFLKVNNQYRDSTLNDDKEEKGFFEKNNRVRMIKLRGQYSMGYLFSEEAMNKYLNKYHHININLSEHVGEVFDTVCGDLFVKAYVPIIQYSNNQSKTTKKESFKQLIRLIPGQFKYHYETKQLEKNLNAINPTDIIDVSVKLHGISAIFGNILVKNQLTLIEKIKKFFGAKIDSEIYDNIYASRTKIRNVSKGQHDNSVWGHWNDIIKDYIPKGVTLYCEIVGYEPNGKFIQKLSHVYDYGCKVEDNKGESKLMIYRVTSKKDDGATEEYELGHVKAFTNSIINSMKADNNGNFELIHPIDILYEGQFGDIYPSLNPSSPTYNADVVNNMLSDKRFGINANEPLCKNKVPREGVVVRINGDTIPEAFKIKGFKFKNQEVKSIDEGNIDTEMAQ